MRLYYSGGTSSMACVIAVEELGIQCELIEVSWSKKSECDGIGADQCVGDCSYSRHG